MKVEVSFSSLEKEMEVVTISLLCTYLRCRMTQITTSGNINLLRVYPTLIFMVQHPLKIARWWFIRVTGVNASYSAPANCVVVYIVDITTQPTQDVHFAVSNMMSVLPGLNYKLFCGVLTNVLGHIYKYSIKSSKSKKNQSWKCEECGIAFEKAFNRDKTL